jgi:acyl-CoA reductase-like NAD-dependent aldehyde dehydrogenase
MNVYNPYNQELIGAVQLTSEEQVEVIIGQGVAAFSEMKQLTGCERARILGEIVTGIQLRYEEFVTCIIRESAKPYIYAKGEVDRALATFRIAQEEALRWPHEIMPLDRSASGSGLFGEYRYFPVGVIFGISPFNFPLNLAVHKIAPAIAAGCAILVKPSSKTPLTMELLCEVLTDTCLPTHAFQVVHCSREVGDVFISHPDIHVLSFTGSPEVGWLMKQRADKKKVVLELGGNAAAIVCEDAHIELAVNELLTGSFAYSGQVCIHTQRIYIHKKQFDFFVSQFVAKAKMLKNGDPMSEDTDLSVMIDEVNAKRVESWTEEAIRMGAELILGGKREGSYYPPTILTGVERTAKIRNEEVFGPVVLLESFDSLDEAITEVNDSRFGLQAAVFTDSIVQRDQCFKALNVGSVVHNLSTTFRVDEMPYGGVKDSGYGREGVQYAMRDFLEGKLLVRK